MLRLETSVQQLVGVGPMMAEKLKRLGIETVRDLLFYYPRAWQDFTNPQKISSLRINEEAIIKAKIFQIHQGRTFKKRMSIIEAELVDDSGQIKAIWFNQAFLAKFFAPGQEWIFAGKVDYNFKTKEKTFAVSQYEKEPTILPIYSETEGITSKYLRRLIQPLINQNLEDLAKEYLPKDILEKEELIGLPQALREIHFPKNSAETYRSKRRLGFDELFLIALLMAKKRAELDKVSGAKMQIDEKKLREFVSKLPFKLTNAQRRSAWQIVLDLDRLRPMNRLLQGDVGSGKTVVAVMAAFVTFMNHYQAVWLAPTEVLANQHYQNVLKMLKPWKVKVGLMTSAKKIADLENDDLIIGTHALIQKGIKFDRLALIIVDEQHRFGVKQRAFLRQGPDEAQDKIVPHLLSMTATPIPRTLALSLYGDLDVSIIDEMPVGRKKVETYAVKPEKRSEAYKFIEKEILAGRQAFVICPLIEEAETEGKLFDLERKSVISEFNKLSKKVFPKFQIAMLHGRMKAAEKEKIMAGFTNGKINILVSTAVIEVGIDISNATVMMIEGAERFGLAQLHQFRGRVGRGEFQSFCFLFSESWSENNKKRLEAMTRSNNGFELAEMDLAIRGPGELVGIRQSGLPDLKMASLRDIILVKKAKEAAEKVIRDGLMNFPSIQEKLSAYEAKSHLE